MRKACIELFATDRMAYLIAGETGAGRCLLAVQLSGPDSVTTETERWQKAVARCQMKASELKYEVTRIRGGRLAGL